MQERAEGKIHVSTPKVIASVNAMNLEKRCSNDVKYLQA